MIKLEGEERRVLLQWLEIVTSNKELAFRQCEIQKEHWRKVVQATTDMNIDDVNQVAKEKYNNAFKLVDDIEIMERVIFKLNATETEE